MHNYELVIMRISTKIKFCYPTCIGKKWARSSKLKLFIAFFNKVSQRKSGRGLLTYNYQQRNK